MEDKVEKTEKKNKKYIDIILIVLLALIPFLHVGFGVEFTDTAYSLGNYEYSNGMNLTWLLATFWANMLGKLFTMLPFGHTWIGMKFYTTLIPVSGVIMSYVYLKKYVPRVILFLGGLLTISLFWCPTTILYNYLTYILFTAATIIIIASLEKEKRWGLFAAGIVLAFNVFVRFPNITEVSLILLVWYSAFLKRKKIAESIKDTLVCIGGFFAGTAINIFLTGMIFGFNSFPQMISSLFSMTNENSTYKPIQMIWAIVRSYTTYYKPLILLIAMTVFCFVLSAIMKKHLFRIISIVLQVLLYVVFLVWAYRNRVYVMHYSEYPSMFFWMVAFLTLSNCFAICTMLRKRHSVEIKLVALATLIIIWITPLGSNNGLYSTMNNLFIVAPATLFMIWIELFKGRNFFELLDLEAKNSMVSTRITVGLLLISIIIHCTLFGIVFVFRDSGFPAKNCYAVKGNEVLVGMHTNKDNQMVIAELTKIVDENSMKGKKAVFFGDIPGLSYILKMPCAISHTWPDLGSFTVDDFKNDFESFDEKPYIFINNDYCENIRNSAGESYLTEKYEYLTKYLEDNDYKLIGTAGDILVYSPY